MRHFIRSFQHAFNGIFFMFRGQRNFSVQLCMALLAFVLGLCFGVSRTEFISIGICTALVLSLEMINTSIEILCNKLSLLYDPEIKKIKDVAAGAVLLACIISAIIGCCIFLPKILIFFQHV